MVSRGALKEQALLVVMGMASKGINRAELGRALAQAGQTPVELEIIKAEYGVGKQRKDVTDILRRHVGDFPVIVLPSTNYNASLGGDPAPGIPKELKIQYRINGQPVGEIGIEAAYAGHYGVPVIAGSGDEAAGREAHELLFEGPKKRLSEGG